MTKKTLTTYALVLLMGLASGLALPRVLSATLAWAGSCYAELCYVQTTNPTSVSVWIDDAQVGSKKLNASKLDSFTVYFRTSDR